MPKKKDPDGSDKPRITAGQFVRTEKASLAREFRKLPTAHEKKAWTILRNRGLLGLKFRRQQVIDGFIVDFYCPELRPVLELDGAVHDSEYALHYDKHRTAYLKSQGIRTLRLKNENVTVAGLVNLLRGYIET